jgi:peroxiredoxin
LPKGLGAQAGSVGLKDFAGKRKVLVSFFPAAFTAG